MGWDLRLGLWGRSALAQPPQLARQAGRRDVRSLGAPAVRDARQAIAADRGPLPLRLTCLLGQQQEAP